MAFSKTKVLASAMTGKLVDQAGAPVSGVTIQRTWKDSYSNDEGVDETSTDASGQFAFREVSNSSFWSGVVPHTPGISQTFEALLPEGKQLLVYLSKGNYEANGEISDLARRPSGIRLTCTAGIKDTKDGWYWGTCQLDD